MIFALDGLEPQLHPSVWVAPCATLVGQVEVGEGSSVWFGAVVRGDVFPVRIGRQTNVQDNAVIHVTGDRHPTFIGDGVTIGHAAVLHGCSVGDRALIGIGAIVLDGVEIGEEALIGAGSLVTPGTVIPPGMLAVGRPCRVKRPLTEAELAQLRHSGPHYASLAERYRRTLSSR